MEGVIDANSNIPCPNCGATQRIQIAGRIFCANCGTRLDSGASASQDTSQPAIIPTSQTTHEPAGAVAPDLNQPSAQTVAADPYRPLDHNTQTPTQPVAPLTEQNTPASQQTTAPTAQQFVVNKQPQPEWLRAAANDAVQLNQPQAQSTAAPTSAPASTAVSTDPQAVQTPQINPAAVAQLQQVYADRDNQVAAVTQASAQVAAQQPQQPMTDISLPQQPAQPTENIGNELGGLEDARNPVISDAQFSVLAKSAQQPVSLPQQAPTMTNPTTPTPIHDIRPAKANLSDITKVGVTPTTITSNIEELPTPANTSNKGTGMKVASAVATIAAIAIVSIYVWQINYPNLAVKVAGAKSGLAVSMPTYMPAGWRLSGDISASPGLVQYNLKSGEGNQSIAITQARSDWDSQALAENYLGKKTQQYLALQAQGLTIYVYGGNSATWVNHGSWYKLEGKGPDINQDQIIKIATSL